MYGINPQVILSLIESQSGLVTAAAPTQTMFNHALSMDCPAVPGGCSSFTAQVDQSALLLKSIMLNPDSATIKIGSQTLPYHANQSCGNTTVTIQNAATAAIYSYPGNGYVPNGAALSAGIGQGDSCSSYGIRNFYANLNLWFGTMNIYDYTPIYRFWSNQYKSHFFTSSQTERDTVINTMSGTWSYEGARFTVPRQTEEMCKGLPMVYRFWSDQYKGHFYTLGSFERDSLISSSAGIWRYEGPVFCASTTATKQNPDAVYRFWSDTYKHHFYTSSIDEKNYISSQYPTSIWRYEGVAYYAKS